MLLNLKEIRVRYGKAEVIKGVSIEVGEGSITGLVGPNGAGKSTILRAISGLLPIAMGEIWFENKRIDKMASYDIVRLGVIQVPERRRLFPYMSVMENLKMGTFLRKDKSGVKDDLSRVWQLFPILKERHNQQARTLSGGEAQMLAIGRALMAKPKLLLLDEPSFGLAPLIVESFKTVIRDLNKVGISILLVEQNAGLALEITDIVYVLELGNVVIKGQSKELLNHEIIRKAFLGG